MQGKSLRCVDILRQYYKMCRRTKKKTKECLDISKKKYMKYLDRSKTRIQNVYIDKTKQDHKMCIQIKDKKRKCVDSFKTKL